MLARVIPSWLRGYERPWLRADAIREGVSLVIARDIGQVRDVLRRAGAEAPFVQVHRTIQDAVDAVSAGEVSRQD